MAATAESSPSRFLDLWTIAAIAVSATVITNFIHEGLGHGGLCVATGARPMVLSTVHFQCSADTRLVAAGGTLANLVFGAVFWAAARAVKRAATWRYFFWLLMTFNLFDAGGYFLFSGIGNFGDWAAVVAGWQPPWAWRVGLVALGTVTYFLLFVPFCLRELRPHIGRDAEIRVRRARQLTVVPYLTSGVLSCAAGALNPVGPLLILVSAAAASFGGHSGLAWMWTLLHGPRIPSSEFQMPEIERSPGWMVAAAVLAIVFIAGLGPGVKFKSVLRLPGTILPIQEQRVRVNECFGDITTATVGYGEWYRRLSQPANLRAQEKSNFKKGHRSAGRSSMAVFNITIVLPRIKSCLLLTFLICGSGNTAASQTPDTIHRDVSGRTRVNTKDGITYVWIAPGSFQMGCSPGDGECFDEEKPRHMVTITKGFWIGQTLVTQAAYQRLKGNNPSHFHGNRLPVDSVTWDNANAYCSAIGMRLPTEAEWEYAARAGGTRSRYGAPDAIAWYADNSGNHRIDSVALWEKDQSNYQNQMTANDNRTHEVGQKPANAWKLYDMLGNVWEWTNDWYDEKYYSQSPSRDPRGPLPTQSRVVRGGTWAVSADKIRVSFRGRDEPSNAYYTIGFRCAGEVP